MAFGFYYSDHIKRKSEKSYKRIFCPKIDARFFGQSCNLQLHLFDYWFGVGRSCGIYRETLWEKQETCRR